MVYDNESKSWIKFCQILKYLLSRTEARWQKSKRTCSPSPTNSSKKTHKHVKQFAQNINWMLAEELKPPKRARNSWHNWVEQKKNRERERKGIRMDKHSREEAVKEKGNSHPRKPPPKQRKYQPSWRDLQDAKESTAAGLRTKNQSERSTDHRNYWRRHHSLRCSGQAGHWDLDSGGQSMGAGWGWQCGDSLRG